MSNIIKYDFQGNLYSFRRDGWFNATEAAARFGKRPVDWLKLPETKRYVSALSNHSKVKESHFAQARRGGANPGTWLHPKLAVRFAQWLSIDFAIWCDDQIDAIIRNGIRAQGNADLIPLLLRPNASDWELRFPASYYHALARMTNTRYMGHAAGTPMQYGQVTDAWVYGCILPADIHAQLKDRRQKSEKMHQWLTAGGKDVLDRQIALVTSIASTSADYADFKTRMMLVSSRGGQLGIVYPKVA